jgi:hypothetical protein
MGLDVMPEFQGVTDIVEGLIRSARALNGDGSIIKKPPRNGLIHSNRFHFIEHQFQRAPLDEAHFHKDPSIGYGEF